MKNILLSLAAVFGSMIMWLVTQRFVQLCEDVRAIREALETRSEPHVLFRVSPSQQSQQPERMLL